VLDLESRLQRPEQSVDHVSERLIAALTEERTRERKAFEATVASLAERLRQLDARAEFLARELRARDQAMADQSAAIAMHQRTAQALQSAQNAFLASRAGRALAFYARLKRAILRR